MTVSAPHDLFIDGEWRAASDGARLDVIDPASEEPIDSVPIATDADLDDALRAADRSWREWRGVDAWTRSATLRRVAGLLRERIEEMAVVLTEEQGKPVAESRGELGAAADQFDWYADEARRIYGRTVEGHSPTQRILVMRQPVGPVAAFTPWNFPALLPSRKIAPAIAAGCSIILKPAEEAPRTALGLAVACADAGVPSGIVNMVTGDPAHISAHLIGSDVIRKVSLTGSVPVGRLLLHLAADRILPVSMELGGHAPVLIFPDADLDRAAAICARGKFRNCGQVCIAASRFYVHSSVAASFTEKLVAQVASLRVGDGRDPSTEVGPLANARRRDAVEALVADAVGRGARVEIGGHRPDELPRGYFYAPTVLSNVDPDSDVMRTEPFGPLAPIATFEDLEHALALANSTPYGLAGYVFARDTSTAFLAAEGLEVGMVGVNHLLLASAEIPFGGVKQSGFGREGGAEGIEPYTVTKYVNLELDA